MNKFSHRRLTAVFTLALLGFMGAEGVAPRAQAQTQAQTQAAGDEAAVRRDRQIPEERKVQSGFALGAFATIRAKEVVYISEPITSGRRLYQFMDAQGYKTIDEAKKDPGAFFKAVVGPNLEEGDRAADSWAKKVNGAVIATTDFEKNIRGQKAPQWGQDDFMTMWISLVEKKVTQMVMVDGWQYSNGSGEEYLQAVLMQMGDRSRSNITITDERGKTLHLDKGLRLMSDAFDDVRGRGLDARNMAETLARLVEAERRYEAAAPGNGQRAGHKLSYDRKKVSALAEKLRGVLKKDYPDVQAIVEKAPSAEYSPLDDLFRPVVKPPAP